MNILHRQAAHDLDIRYLRHAESEANLDGSIIGGRWTDAQLTSRGLKQATALGHHLLERGLRPDFVFASPAVRTIRTAQQVLDVLGLDRDIIVKDDELQERHQGDWSGLRTYDVFTDEVYQEMHRQGDNHRPPNGESFTDAGIRMVKRLEAGFDIAGSRRNPPLIFAFTHGDALRGLTANLRGMKSGASSIHVPKVSETRVLRVNGRGQWQYTGQSTVV